jgi:hypothetical protein
MHACSCADLHPACIVLTCVLHDCADMHPACIVLTCILHALCLHAFCLRCADPDPAGSVLTRVLHALCQHASCMHCRMHVGTDVDPACIVPMCILHVWYWHAS